MANSAAGIAPAKIMLVLLREIQPKINSPKPPAAMSEANVATPTLITAAVLLAHAHGLGSFFNSGIHSGYTGEGVADYRKQGVD